MPRNVKLNWQRPHATPPDAPSPTVCLILLDPGQDPVELAARDFRMAKFAVTGHSDLEWRVAVGTVGVAPRRTFAADAPNERPVLGVGARPRTVAAEHLARIGHRVVEARREQTDRYRIVVRIAEDIGQIYA